MSRYLLLLGLPSLAAAYSFNIDNTPRQCEDLTVSITGSGQPPYTLLVIPFGPTPLNTSKEVRRIIQKNFTDNSITFPLNYPVSSQFIVQVCTLASLACNARTCAYNRWSCCCVMPRQQSQTRHWLSLSSLPIDFICPCERKTPHHTILMRARGPSSHLISPRLGRKENSLSRRNLCPCSMRARVL